MQFISENESAALVDHELAFQAIHEALLAACSEEAASFPVVHGHGSDRRNTFSVKASSTEKLAGLKVGSYWPDNLSRELPRHNSLILIFNQLCGKIEAAIEAGKVNAYRTAAADAVAAYYLSCEDASVIAIFGTGNQARYECAAVSRIRKGCTFLVVGRDPEKAAMMVYDLVQQGITAEISDAETACRKADIIITATTARTPLFEADWIKPGTHIASMGSDTAGKQELPPALFSRSRLFCDLPSQSRKIGEFQHTSNEIPVTALGEVIAGKVSGRTRREDITIFDSSGLSVQDLYIGYHILNKWRAATTGKTSA